MDRCEMVNRLKGLREEIERDGGVRIAALEALFALALWDVCRALGLSEEECDVVLGQEGAAYVEGVLCTRVWTTEKERAAVV